MVELLFARAISGALDQVSEPDLTRRPALGQGHPWRRFPRRHSSGLDTHCHYSKLMAVNIYLAK